MSGLSVLGQKRFYRCRRGPRRCPGGKGGPHPRVQGAQQAPACGPWVAPQVALRSSGVFRRIKIPVNFQLNLTIFPVVDFLKYKNSKTRKLALGILSIG